MTTTMTMAESVAQLHNQTIKYDGTDSVTHQATEKYKYWGWVNFPEGCSGLKGGLMLYLEKGIVAGSGLMAVLEGDLWKAVNALDDQNWRHLKELCTWMYNNPPSIAYGNRDKVVAWVNHQGAEGYEGRNTNVNE